MMELDSGPGHAAVARDKTAPFLIRTFVKIGSFHRLTLFEDGKLPTTDEQQIFTWRNATLREVLTTIRNTATHVPEYRHPLARFSFRVVYADSSIRGRFAHKDLGMVYSRDILGEPGSLNTTAPRLLEDIDGEHRELTQREREERTLEELRFVPGDYLLVAVLLPKTAAAPTELSVKGAAAPANGWKGQAQGPGRSDSGWAGPIAPGGGRGGGHWRGESNAPPAPSGPRGRGAGRGGFDRDRDRDGDRFDRRPPLPRRSASPPKRGSGWGHRGGRRGRMPRSRSKSKSRSRSRSKSRSPPPPRRRRYD